MTVLSIIIMFLAIVSLTAGGFLYGYECGYSRGYEIGRMGK